MGLFSSIGSSIAGGVIGAFTDPIVKITQTIASTRVALEAEKNKEVRIQMEERVEALKAKRDVLIGEASSGIRLNALIRALFALTVLSYLIKVIVFDLTLGYWTGWSTPPLPEPLDTVMLAIIGFYFVDSMVQRITR